MDKLTLALKLGLNHNASQTEVLNKLSALVEQTKLLRSEKNTLTANIEALNDRLKSLQKEALQKPATDLIDKAIRERKLTAGDRQKYLKLALVEFDTVKTLIEAMPAFESLETRLRAGKDSQSFELSELLKLSGRELYLQGKMERLKALSPYHFQQKWKEYTGQEYSLK